MTTVLTRILIVVAAVGLGTPPTIQSTEVGYVVEISKGSTWEARTAGGPARPLAAGQGLFHGDTVHSTGEDPAGDARISILLFATGRIKRLATNQTVDAEPPAANGTFQRLKSAIQRRLNNERLVPGLVRSGSIVRDAVVVAHDTMEWSHVLPSLSVGLYSARFRRLGPNGEPLGAWTTSERFEVTDKGSTPAISNLPADPGLWLVSVRHQRVPSLNGEAWILVTSDADDKTAFDELATALAESVRDEGPELEATATRVRRAALLALADR